MKASDFLNAYSGNPKRFADKRYCDGRYGLTVNGFHPLRIETIRNSLYTNEIIDIKDESGQEIATICLVKGQSIDPSQMSDIIYSAYIADIEHEEYGGPHVFKSNYLVVKPGRVKKYHDDYKSSSIVWGGFSHSGDIQLPTACKRDHSSITAVKCSNPKHQHQYHLIALAENQPYAFERYLRYYHCLEYIFEWQLIEKLKSSNSSLDGYTDFLRELNLKSDTERLKLTIKPLLDSIDEPAIAEIYKQLRDPDYIRVAREIFFDYGKEHNPLKDKLDKFELIINTSDFNPSALARNSVGHPDQAYLNFIVYTIYRIRCCIAHTKISEYVFKPEDEKFVNNFGEPLIRYVLRKYFGS